MSSKPIELSKLKDKKLIAGLLFSPELGGRVDIQGNDFGITIHYLKTYLEQHPSILSSENAARLITALTSIKTYEDEIRTCPHSLQGVTDTSKKLSAQLAHLTEGEALTLSGGWANQRGGHAMIYQFKKTEHGLIFSIYNSGSGLNFHDHRFTKTTEIYSPIKAYVIKEPHEELLKNLMVQLVKPRLYFATRDPSYYSSDKLYQQISSALVFLKAEEHRDMIETIFEKNLSTKGQISGTCTQDSLNEFLKIELGDLGDYQRFMFRFRMDTLKQVMSNIDEQSSENLELIQLAIQENLKLTHDIIDLDMENDINTLMNFLDEITAKRQGIEPHTPQHPEHSPRNFVLHLNRPNTKKVQNEPSLPTPLISIPTELEIRDISPRSLAELIQRWTSAPYDTDPISVIQEIESLVLKLPLPPLDEASPCEAYASIATQADNQAMLNHLMSIRDLYTQNYEMVLPSTPLAAHLITHTTLLAQFRYFGQQLNHHDPQQVSFDNQILYKIQSFLKDSQHNVSLMSQAPVFDRRLTELQLTYLNSPAVKPLSTEIIYQGILHRAPEFTQAILTSASTYMDITLHQVLLEQDASGSKAALCYLLTYLNPDGTFKVIPGIQREACQPILDKITSAIMLEQKTIESLIKLNPYYSFEKQPTYETNIPYKWKSPLDSIRDVYGNTVFAKIRDHLFHFTPTNRIQLLLYSPPSSENSIQLNSDSLFEREVLQLRLSPKHQVNLTIDYFTNNLHRLSTIDAQSYLIANLFEPALLQDTLDNDPNFIVRFDQLIQKALLFFQNPNGKLSDTSLFFIQLRLQVHQYAAKNTNETKHNPAFLNRLKEDTKNILELLKSHQSPSIESSLIHLLFINQMNIHALDPNYFDDPSVFHDTVASYFGAKRSRMMFETTASAYALHQQCRQFEIYLNQHSEKISIETIQSIYSSSFHPLVSLSSVNKEGLLFTLKDDKDEIVIDASRGLISKNGLTSQPIPLHLRNNPLLPQLNINPELSCFISSDQKLIEFPNETRIFQENSRIIAVHKKIKGRWYQFEPLTVEQRKYYQYRDYYSLSDFSSLPLTLKDDDKTLWLSLEQDATGLILQNDNICYDLVQRPESQGFECCDRQGFILTIPRQDSIKNIYHFESPLFCQINLSRDQTLGSLLLPRYGIELSYQDDKMTRQGSTYHLLDASKSVFRPEVAQLTFGDKHNQPKECIVPVQKFYVHQFTTQQQGHYYTFTHDISAHLASAQVNGEDSQWHFECSERSISYPIINGKPSPQSAADAFYLCYLYLASHEHDKALNVLNELKYRHPLTGSIEEQRYLSWIIHALPEKATLEESVQNSPRDIACQLKALALYTDFMEHNEIKKPKKDTSPRPLTRNEICLKKEQESLNQFNQDLKETIVKLFSQMLHVKSHLNVTFHLDDVESKSLMMHTRGHAFSATMDYHLLQLQLKSLHHTLHQLEAIQHSKPSAVLAKQIKKIREKMEQEALIMTTQTRLVLRSFDVNKLPMTYTSWQYTRFNLLDQQAAPITLSVSYDANELTSIYPTLIQIAQNPSHPQFQLLKTICRGHIINHSSPQSYLFQAYALLYKITENPGIALGTGSKTLSELREIVNQTEVSPIQCYEPDLIFDKELAKASEILTEIKRHARQRSPIIIKEVTLPESLGMYALIETMPQPEKSILLKAWRDYHLTSTQYLIDPSTHDEKEAGELIYHRIHSQREIAKTALSEQAILTHLTSHTTKFRDYLHEYSRGRWDAIIRAANQKLIETHGVQVASGQHKPITQKDLLRCYFNADHTAYTLTTSIEDKREIEALHQSIHEALMLDIQRQQVDRLSDVLASTRHDELPSESTLAKIGELLLAQNLPEASNDPCFMLLEYLEGEKSEDSSKGILLRREQLHAINNLLTKENTIEKVIMGGGKSKVILPLVAQKKADGHRFVIYEVPEALLDTNHADFNEISQRLFHQKAHRFQFSRSSDCSPQHLQSIYEYFNEITTQQDYLVTTGHAMQSLELKLFELLIAGPISLKKQDQDMWQKQVYWSEKIVLFLKDHGYTVIDEVHQGLLLKKKLNYTIGMTKKINQRLITLQVNLFEFLNHISPEFIKAPGLIKSEALAQALLTHPESPLKKYIVQLENMGIYDWQTALSSYFNNEAQPEFLPTTHTELNDALAFYKEQLKLLPTTLTKHYKEHYGPQKSTDLPAALRIIAVPYSANNKPAGESTRFGNTLETLNYTAQSLLIEGLNEELLSILVAQWHARARLEMQQNTALHSIQETSTGQTVALLLRGTAFMDLADLNSKSESQMQALLHAIQQHPLQHQEVLFYTLEHHILGQVDTEASILHSHAQNHTSLYRTTHGVSGTPNNHRTQSLSFDQSTSLGTDGYIQKIIIEKKTQVKSIHFENLELFLNQTMHPGIHAIIDICAMFEKLSNIEVAHALANYFNQHQPPEPIKYILYFEDLNGVDTLCAWDIDSHKRIILGTSNPDEINQKLGYCPLHQRFTYYDQAHHVGVDLKQPEHSTGMCLVDEKTQMQSFLQGAMRMRGLAHTQDIEMIVPETIRDLSLQQLLEHMICYEETQLQDDVFYASIEKLDNIIREEAKRLIYSIDKKEILKKHAYMKVLAKDIFIEIKSNDLYQQYGQIYTLENAQRVLENHRDNLLSLWSQRLTQLGLEAPHQEILKERMDTIIQESVPFSGERYLSPIQSSHGSEVEVQKEVSVLKEAQQELYTSKETLHPQRYENVDKVQLLNFGLPGKSSFHTPLSSLVSIPFSKHLHVSPNYQNVYWGQQNLAHAHTKPVHVIMFKMVDQQLTACVISIQEAEEIAQMLEVESIPQLWLTTTEHTPLTKGAPKDILDHPEYLSIIEQVKLFNGQLDDLIQQKEPLRWLNLDSDTILDAFTHHLLPFRDTSLDKVKLLQSALSNHTQYLQSVDEHAFDPDLVTITWASRYPDAIASDLFEMQTLTDAIAKANDTMMSTPLAEITMPRGISINTRAYLQQHWALLSKIKIAIDELTHLKKSSYDFFNDPNHQSLEKFFFPPLNLETLLMHYKNLTAPDALMAESYASLDLLVKLFHHPLIVNKTFILEKIKSHILTQPKSLKYLLEKPADPIIEALLLSLPRASQKTEEALEKLIDKTSSIDNLKKILALTEQTAILNTVFQKITSDQSMSHEQLLLMILHHKAVSEVLINSTATYIMRDFYMADVNLFIPILIQHPQLSIENKASILRSPNMNFETKKALITGKPCPLSIEELKALIATLHTTEITTIIENIHDETLLKAILTHPMLTTDQLSMIIKKGPLSSEQLSEILTYLFIHADRVNLTALILMLLRESAFSKEHLDSLADHMTWIVKHPSNSQTLQIIDTILETPYFDLDVLNKIIMYLTDNQLNTVIERGNEEILQAVILFKKPMTPSLKDAMLKNKCSTFSIFWQLRSIIGPDKPLEQAISNKLNTMADLSEVQLNEIINHPHQFLECDRKTPIRSSIKLKLIHDRHTPKDFVLALIGLIKHANDLIEAIRGLQTPIDFPLYNSILNTAKSLNVEHEVCLMMLSEIKDHALATEILKHISDDKIGAYFEVLHQNPSLTETKDELIKERALLIRRIDDLWAVKTCVMKEVILNDACFLIKLIENHASLRLDDYLSMLRLQTLESLTKVKLPFSPETLTTLIQNHDISFQLFMTLANEIFRPSIQPLALEKIILEAFQKNTTLSVEERIVIKKYLLKKIHHLVSENINIFLEGPTDLDLMNTLITMFSFNQEILIKIISIAKKPLEDNLCEVLERSGCSTEVWVEHILPFIDNTMLIEKIFDSISSSTLFSASSLINSYFNKVSLHAYLSRENKHHIIKKYALKLKKNQLNNISTYFDEDILNDVTFLVALMKMYTDTPFPEACASKITLETLEKITNDYPEITRLPLTPKTVIELIEHQDISYPLLIKLDTLRLRSDILKALNRHSAMDPIKKVSIKNSYIGYLIQSSNACYHHEYLKQIETPIDEALFEKLITIPNLELAYQHILPKINDPAMLIKFYQRTHLREYLTFVRENTYLSKTEKNNLIKTVALRLERQDWYMMTDEINSDLLNDIEFFMALFNHAKFLIDKEYICTLTYSSMEKLRENLPKNIFFQYLCMHQKLAPNEKLKLTKALLEKEGPNDMIFVHEDTFSYADPELLVWCIHHAKTSETLQKIAAHVKDANLKIISAFFTNPRTPQAMILKILTEADSMTWQTFLSTEPSLISKPNMISLMIESTILNNEEKKTHLTVLVEQDLSLFDEKTSPYLPLEESHPGYQSMYDKAKTSLQNATDPSLALTAFVITHTSLNHVKSLIETTQHSGSLKQQIQQLIKNPAITIAFILSAIRENQAISPEEKIQLSLETMKLIHTNVQIINDLPEASVLYTELSKQYREEEYRALIDTMLEEAVSHKLLPLLSAMSTIIPFNQFHESTRTILTRKLDTIRTEIPDDETLRRAIKEKIRVCLNTDSTNRFKQFLTVVGVRTPPTRGGGTPQL